jgi:hypothetical protein
MAAVMTTCIVLDVTACSDDESGIGRNSDGGSGAQSDGGSGGVSGGRAGTAGAPSGGTATSSGGRASGGTAGAGGTRGGISREGGAADVDAGRRSDASVDAGSPSRLDGSSSEDASDAHCATDLSTPEGTYRLHFHNSTYNVINCLSTCMVIEMHQEDADATLTISRFHDPQSTTPGDAQPGDFRLKATLNAPTLTLSEDVSGGTYDPHVDATLGTSTGLQVAFADGSSSYNFDDRTVWGTKLFLSTPLSEDYAEWHLDLATGAITGFDRRYMLGSGDPNQDVSRNEQTGTGTLECTLH